MRVLFLTSEGPASDLIRWLSKSERDEVLVQMDQITPDYLDKVKPEFILSYNYRFIIKEDILINYPDNAINMHIALLPWNRGADPNFWGIVENTPKGVTIHRLDKGIDTGEVIVQREVKLDIENETLSSSYDKLHLEIQDLFKKNWSQIKLNAIGSVPQVDGGSSHLHNEFLTVEHILGEEGWDVPLNLLIDRYQLLSRGNN